MRVWVQRVIEECSFTGMDSEVGFEYARFQVQVYGRLHWLNVVSH